MKWSIKRFMGIVITGASGFVGREIIPILSSSGQKLLLVGRDKNKLQKLFPSLAVTNYENLATEAKGFDTLLHLAILNNNQPGNIADFRAANVRFLEETMQAAKSAGIKKFIYTSTIQAMNITNKSPYAQSKCEADKFLSSIEDISVVSLKLSTVYGETFAGKLSYLSKVPNIIRNILFKIFASLKPTVHTKNVAETILELVEEDGSTELILSDRQVHNWVYFAVKRTVDLSFVFIVAFLFWWIFVVAWIAIKYSSAGPGIFSQKRVGKNEILFTCYKFRTMALGTEQAGTHEISENCITPIGRFLRKTKIDELPQIWNIFKNDLSLVGPRPCLPVQRTLVAERKIRGVFDVKGGLTGLAQIQSVDMSDPPRLARLDAEYIALRTILLDLKIIVATAFGRGQGDNVSK